MCVCVCEAVRDLGEEAGKRRQREFRERNCASCRGLENVKEDNGGGERIEMRGKKNNSKGIWEARNSHQKGNQIGSNRQPTLNRHTEN